MMTVFVWIDTISKLLQGTGWRYLSLYILAALSAGLEVVSIGILFPLLSLVAEPAAGAGTPTVLPERIVALLQVSRIGVSLERLAVWLVIIFALKNLIRFLVEYNNARLANEIRGRWMSQLFRRYLGSHYQLFIQTKQGVMVHNLFDLTVESLAGLKQFVTFFMYSVSTVIVLVGMVVISWQLTLLSVGVLGGLYLLVNRPLVRRATSLGKQRLTVYQAVNALPAEAFRGIREIKTYGALSSVAQAYETLVKHMVDIRVRINFYQLLPAVFPEVLLVALLSATLIYLNRSSEYELPTLLPLMGTYVYASYRLFTSGGVLLRNILAIVTYSPSLALLSDLLSRDAFPDVRSGSTPVKRGGETLELSDVWFSYDTSDVLKGASATFRRGTITAIVGPSGAGKSTLADLLIRIVEPKQGTIQYDGSAIHNFSLEDWRARIGFISQDTFLFHGTIRENIALGVPNTALAAIEQAARLAQAHDFVASFEDGYDTIVGERGARLSGGQRQRIAIARALLRQPDILILDEATSALDPASEAAIIDTIRGLASDKIVIMITHREQAAAKATMRFILQDGRLWASEEH